MERQLRAYEEILLAARELSGEEEREFSEWDLTVCVWQRNPNRFGCRGYEDLYPDHKRVMMEVMGRGKANRGHGWLEKTKPNHYRITSLGRVEADRLRGLEAPTQRRAVALYDAIQRYALHPVLLEHLESPSKPETWLGAAAFLSLDRNDGESLDRRLHEISSACARARDWFSETRAEVLLRGDAGRPIPRERLDQLDEFLQVLRERFAAQFAAIRSR